MNDLFKKFWDFIKKIKSILGWGAILSIGIAILLWGLSNLQIEKWQLAQTTEISGSISSLSEDISKIRGIDCREIAEHSWDIQNLIIIDKDLISLETKKGMARFKKPIHDLLILDFTFKPTDPRSMNTTIALKDEKHNEVSLTIGAGKDQTDAGDYYYQTLYWIYKKTGKLDPDKETSQTLPTFQRNSEIKLRIEIIQKPDHLLASGFILYTPTDKKMPISSYLKEFSVERFYNKEVFLHLGIRNDGQKLENGILLKIIQCRIDQKPELQ